MGLMLFQCSCSDENQAEPKTSSYIPFPPKPIRELTGEEKKLLERDDFVRIEPGEFLMGSPTEETGHGQDEAQHRVKITKPFYMGKTEVTVHQWNLLQPETLRKDGNFSLPDDIGQTIAFFQETVKDSKNRPKELSLNPKERVYTVEILEKIVDVIQKGSLGPNKPKDPVKIKSSLTTLQGYIIERKHLPVTDVSYPQAKSFCWRRTELAWKESTIPRSMVFRLPAEAEWEYACRAGIPGVCGLEDGDKLSGMNANLNGGKKQFVIGNEPYLIFKEKLVSVAITKTKYPSNPWGIHDMHGNVYEWCYDYYGTYPDSLVIDPTGPIRGKKRVLRGGSFLRIAHQCRSAARHAVEPSWRGSEIGFRLVLGYPL